MNPPNDIRLLEHGRIDYRPYVDKFAAKPTRRAGFSLPVMVVLVGCVTLFVSFAT